MNKKLIKRLQNLKYNHGEIDFYDLRDQLSSNKTFATQGSLSNAVYYLQNNMKINVKNIPNTVDKFFGLGISKKTKNNTNKDVHTSANIVDLYLKDIKNLNYKLLTREEERELFKRIKQGDLDAKNELIEKNLKLVITIAKDYQNRGLALEDLIQEGNIGLMKAVDKFDLSYENKFSTYATWWIKQAIYKALLDKTRLVKLPTHLVEQMYIIKKVIPLITNSEKEPSYQEIADYCNTHNLNRKNLDKDGNKTDLTAKDIKYCMDAYEANATVSLDMNIGEENDLPLFECIPSETETPEEIIGLQKLHEIFEKIFTELPNPKMSKILKYRFGWYDNQPKTLRQTGEILGISYEYVRLLQNAAFDWITEHYGDTVLKGWDI